MAVNQKNSAERAAGECWVQLIRQAVTQILNDSGLVSLTLEAVIEQQVEENLGDCEIETVLADQVKAKLDELWSADELAEAICDNSQALRDLAQAMLQKHSEELQQDISTILVNAIAETPWRDSLERRVLELELRAEQARQRAWWKFWA